MFAILFCTLLLCKEHKNHSTSIQLCCSMHAKWTLNITLNINYLVAKFSCEFQIVTKMTLLVNCFIFNCGSLIGDIVPIFMHKIDVNLLEHCFFTCFHVFSITFDLFVMNNPTLLNRPII